ncbi:uncharacterized protein LOC126376977 [Pectinophora gossypiella]|uniref:uncharacterized protein LOC126376977 n=1 Tax=Pectinophora gossypiella TaxID=13191 RepID=UPI00214E2D00|nr:uncharacterized protein LOC126376977 [Pectinophora gossypiella]
MSAGAVVVVRAARAADAAARLRLLRDGLADSHTDAFFYFFFQEVTLQGVVLAGAVLFIFCGVSAAACLLLLPVAAVVVALAVRAHAAATAAAYEAKLRNEAAGWVAELRGPLLVSPAVIAPVVLEHELRGDSTEPQHKEVVGTVSVSEYGAARHACWVWGLAVRRGWRRRGAGAALWECRGTYHRQLLGDVLTLPMAHLVVDLPYA